MIIYHKIIQHKNAENIIYFCPTIATGSLDIFGWFGAMGNGISGMGELIIITLLAGGMLEMIRYSR